MHWRQSGTPGADAFAAKASQAINSVLSILRISKRADGRSNEVWGWGVVISFRISEAVRCADRSRKTGLWPVFSDGRRRTADSGRTADGGRQTAEGRRRRTEGGRQTAEGGVCPRNTQKDTKGRTCHRGHRARSEFTEKGLDLVLENSDSPATQFPQLGLCRCRALCPPADLCDLCTTIFSSHRRLRGFFSNSTRILQEGTERTESPSIQKSNSTTDFSADFADGRGFRSIQSALIRVISGRVIPLLPPVKSDAGLVAAPPR